MVVTAVLAVGLFALPLAVLVAKYLIDDERDELSHVADLTALSVTADLARGHPPIALLTTESDTTLAFYDINGARVIGTGPAMADNGVRAATSGKRVTDGGLAGDFTVDIPVSDDGRIAGAVRASTPLAGAWTRIVAAWLAMTALGAQHSLRSGSSPAAKQHGWPHPWNGYRRPQRASGRARWKPPPRPGCRRSTTSPQASPSPPTGSSAPSPASAPSPPTPPTSYAPRSRGCASSSRPRSKTPPRCDGHHRRRLGRRPPRAHDERPARALRDLPHRGHELPLPTLFDELRRDHHATLADAGRRLTIHTPADLPSAAASAPAIRQVLGVLLDNALRHGQGGVTVAAPHAVPALALDIADEGRIDAPDELFVRRSPSATGHGIGLALARSLTEAEGGRLLLSRRSPTTFTVLLPLAQRHTHPAEADQSS